VTTSPVAENFESGSRYTALPIFLIEAAAVVAVGSFSCHGQQRLRTYAAVAALAGVLSVGWITDFRYQGLRSGTTNWSPTATAWLHACQHTRDGIIREPARAPPRTAIPCASVRRLCPAARSRGASASGGACRDRLVAVIGQRRAGHHDLHDGVQAMTSGGTSRWQQGRQRQAPPLIARR